ncbi:ion channel [Candidatus Nitrosocosmicus arcticus]|uniref:Putative voltage gated ion transport protein n=1 Tax=Candidatus Nitrosocosmicus arcticus TaxID=2035267 RepID=A0A557SV11_9ARCH|nr:ion channel [Candidatus Nitrosocosmicus arcticus]TVP40421.1 putative voltage gated ion transport protein [Candidatus Nitrosocosmicus arcticus]
MKRNTNFEFFIISLTGFSVFLILFQYFYDPLGQVLLAVFLFDFIVSIILAFDFAIRIKKSKQGYKYFLTHLYEIPSFIPLYTLTLLEANTVYGAGLKSLRLIQIFRFMHILSRTLIIMDEIRNRLLYVVLLSMITVTAGAFTMYFVEHNAPGSKITNLGDAVWWAVVTVTTVGYGDVYPVTFEGRIIATVIMVIGIAILGILISTLGAQFIESKMKNQRRKDENNIKLLIKDKIDRLEGLQSEEIVTLLNLISNLHGELKNSNSTQKQGFSCAKCNNINPQTAIYCNRCGNQITTGNP